MKFYKKVMGILLSATMAISMAACSSTSTTQETTATATPEEIIQAAEEKMKKVTSSEFEMNVEIAMSMSGQDINMKTNSTVLQFVEPMKLKMDMTVDMGELGSQTANIYGIEENEKVMMYVTDNAGNWVKQEMPDEQLEAYDTQESIVTYLDAAVGLKEAGKEEINGAEATKYEGVIAKDALEDIMERVGTTKNLEAMLVGTDMTSEELYTGLSDVAMAVWIDAEGYPVKYEMDMTEMMQGFMRKVVQTAGASEQEAQELSVSTAKFSVINKNFNNATDFELPEEAKSAIEVAA